MNHHPLSGCQSLNNWSVVHIIQKILLREHHSLYWGCKHLPWDVTKTRKKKKRNYIGFSLNHQGGENKWHRNFTKQHYPNFSEDSSWQGNGGTAAVNCWLQTTQKPMGTQLGGDNLFIRFKAEFYSCPRVLTGLTGPSPSGKPFWLTNRVRQLETLCPIHTVTDNVKTSKLTPPR